MKKLLCLLLAVAMLLALCGCKEEESNPAKTAKPGNRVGDLCYGTQLTEIDQNGYTDHTFDPTTLGKITVINFWAYWCSPCVGELPHFDKVAREMADEVAVVAVHCDEIQPAQSFIEDNYPNGGILFAMDKQNDPSVYYRILGGSGSIPYTVVLDTDGVIRQTFVGAITYEELLEAIDLCR